MEEFEVLRVTQIDYDEVTNTKFKQPLLYVDVSFESFLVFFIYQLNEDLEWMFKKFNLSNGDIRIQERIYNEYHRRITSKRINDDSFIKFSQEMNKLGPDLLNHPKVRIKSVLYK